MSFCVLSDINVVKSNNYVSCMRISVLGVVWHSRSWRCSKLHRIEDALFVNWSKSTEVTFISNDN